MRCLTCAAFCLFGVLPVQAGDKEPTKLNALAPQEIAEGWILLFDGETHFGWKSNGNVQVSDGALTIAKDASATFTTAFGDFDLHFECRGAGRLAFTSEAGKASSSVGSDSWQTVVMEARQDPDRKGSITASVASTPQAVRGKVAYGPSPVSLLFERSDSLSVRNVKLKPIGLKSIFNGKDLSGWKVIPGHKSKFSVNEKGELTIKDGNGDIQTEGQWDDFVLQLEVFSHGKHLNSGVFFRCLPGQFWSGYEAQIRNQWEGDDRNKAVDYGTGGIYNRQPARKVVSNDHEWFTMTVVARGKHIATWVNGYQVTDFTDQRPLSMSARKGCKLDKGPISLQGHDPTTDLSFRNIRIAELPKASK
jgi:hypothetical protein